MNRHGRPARTRRIPRSSRRRYRAFIRDYKARRLDAVADQADKAPDATASKPRTRREYVRDYLRWLWPHRRSPRRRLRCSRWSSPAWRWSSRCSCGSSSTACCSTPALDTAARLARLHLAGGAVPRRHRRLASSIGVLKDYRQRLLNTRVMLSLRRSLFDRLLHLPLPKLWDMKTGGILSRLTGDVDTTTGLLQMAIVSPALSVIRLVIAVGVLLTLNWRLALTALADHPRRRW